MDTYARKLLEIQKFINDNKHESLSALEIFDMIKQLDSVDPTISINSVGNNNIININNESCYDGEDNENSNESSSTCDESIITITSKLPILVTSDYEINSNNFYVGVQTKDSVTIKLPQNPQSGDYYIIKLEGEKTGNVKVTISGNGFLIDGESEKILKNVHDVLRVIFRDNWLVV